MPTSLFPFTTLVQVLFLSRSTAVVTQVITMTFDTNHYIHFCFSLTYCNQRPAGKCKWNQSTMKAESLDQRPDLQPLCLILHHVPLAASTPEALVFVQLLELAIRGDRTFTKAILPACRAGTPLLAWLTAPQSLNVSSKVINPERIPRPSSNDQPTTWPIGWAPYMLVK